VKKMKECNVYYYIYHVEIDELWQGLSYMLVKFGFHYESQCDYRRDEICESIGIKGCNACTCISTTYVGLLYFGNQLFAPVMSFQNGMLENAYSMMVKAHYGIQRLFKDCCHKYYFLKLCVLELPPS
jgi:hypothetical protein